MKLAQTINNLVDYKISIDNKITDLTLAIQSETEYDDIIEMSQKLIKYASTANKIHKMICDLDEMERDKDE